MKPIFFFKSIMHKLRGSKQFKQIRNYYYRWVNFSISRSTLFNFEIMRLNYEIIRLRLQLQNTTNKKIKVIFLVTDKALWGVQSVYDAMVSDPYFDPIVLVLYQEAERKIVNDNDQLKFRSRSTEINYQFFAQQNIRVIKGYVSENDDYINISELKPGIVFYEQPYQLVLPYQYRASEVSSYALTCYVPYGYKVSSMDEANFNNSYTYAMWRVFAESRFHEALFKSHSDIGARNVVTTGYPKFDVYLKKNNEKSGEYWRSRKANIKRIIWAPHWTVNNTSIAFSTFHNNYMFFLDMAKSNSEIDWVFKPHPSLYQTCIDTGLMSVSEIDTYYEKWKNMPNTSILLDGNYFDLFKTSDTLITCSGSFLAEYMPTRNPVLYLINKNSVGLNEIGNAIVKNYYKSYSNDNICNFIERVVLGGDDYMYQDRMKALKYVVVNEHGAGKTILQYIKSQLKPV